MKKKLAVFVSGGGTDLQSIIDAVEKGYIGNAEISIVVSSNKNAYALTRAENSGIRAEVYSKADFGGDEKAMFEALEEHLIEMQTDYIILAGYLRILPPFFVRAFENRIINVHPSLIPKYCGDGYYGMRVHEAVIAAGEKESGATVHFVDEGTDTGKIILQEKVKVYENDTPETLQKRVLELEHKILPKAVKLLTEGKIGVTNC